ncbi:addiction module protein [bacterium]|nr:addiction module protein [bacterium]
MNANAEKIVTEAMELPPEVRAFIAEKLIESLDQPASKELSPEWKAEIKKRSDEIDQSLVQLRNADSVFNRIEKSLP